MANELEIRTAETRDEKEAVYRFRYDVYVEEMGRYRDRADHARRMLHEPEDETGRIGYASENGEVVATVRLSWPGHGPLSERQVRQYRLQPFLDQLPAEALAVGERGMIAPRLRGSDLLLDMMRRGLAFSHEHRIQLTFGACEPHLLNLYLDLGHRTYSDENINSAEAGYLIPLVMVLEDYDYFVKLDSPLLTHLVDFGPDSRIPACVEAFRRDSGAVTSGRLTSPTTYWSHVNEALEDANRVSAFDGLTEEEAIRCLGKSNIIECDAGDRVLKKGGVARNLFVVLDGTLEVRDGKKLVSVLGPGDVFGEIAFLLGVPRSKDVFAATDGVRVLSLSESTIRKTIESDPAVAADLLLNISKMLCFRLLGRG